MTEESFQPEILIEPSNVSLLEVTKSAVTEAKTKNLLKEDFMQRNIDRSEKIEALIRLRDNLQIDPRLLDIKAAAFLTQEEFKEARGSLSNEAQDELVNALQRYTDQYNQQVTETQRNKLLQEATTDALTGLDNRRSWESRTIDLLKQFERIDGKDNYFVLTFMDIDDFKKINDKYGHPVGDVVLKEIAAEMKLKFRDIDLLGRYGGDELVEAGLSGNATPEQIISRFKQIHKDVVDTSILVHSINQDELLTVTQSWGLVIVGHQDIERIMRDSDLKPSDKEYHRELLNRITSLADKEVYEAKRLGKNCVSAVTIKERNPELPTINATEYT